MIDPSDGMEAEFDTVASWTAEVIAGLPHADRIPAACRGSGSPGALHWFLDHLHPRRGETFLDCGAGVGGPAAFAAGEADVRPLVTDPEPGACKAARSLFGLAALQAGTQVPLATGSIGVGWSLGVLCTVDDPQAYLAEIRRVLRPRSRFGLVAYCATHPGRLSLTPPSGNTFVTPEVLDLLLAATSLHPMTSSWIDHFHAAPPHWESVITAVEGQLERRHGNDPRWQAAEERSKRIGALVSAGEVRGRMLVLEAA